MLALIIFVGAMAGYYVSGSLQGVDTETEAEEALPEDDTLEEVGSRLLTIAKGFDYEVSDGQNTSYRVSAEQLVADVEDRMELEVVVVELPQDDGGVIVVAGDRGTIHLDSKSATLEGNVTARDPEGVVLSGKGFEVIREGSTLISTSPVTFGKEGEYRGSARKLAYNLKKKRLTLEGDVKIQTVPVKDPDADSLRCQKLVYDRLERTLRLEGNVRLGRGQEFLEAGRLSVTFGEDENDIRFVRGEQGVNGRYLPVPSGDELASRVDFRGRVLYAEFEEGTRQAKQAEIRGRARRDASIDVIDSSGLSRMLSAPLIRADLVDGEVRIAEAYEPVAIRERLAFAPARVLRRICADSAIVEMDALGELDTMTLTGNVDYQAATGLQAIGDHIIAKGASGTVVIEGEPAAVAMERGDLLSPKITYSDRGWATAKDGVRAEFRQKTGYTLMGGEQKEPLRVTAEEARWEEEPEKVIFRGNVRAWQGSDYLLAREIVGEPDLDLMTATGDIKTVILPQNEDALLGDEDDDEASNEPIEITSNKLVYRQAERLITYEGRSKATQAERVLKCDDMDLELDENDEFDRLLCSGDLVIEDPRQGKEVRGEQAIYVPDSEEVDVTGDPVILSADDGTELRGGRVIYNFGSGVAQVRSRQTPVEPADEVADDPFGEAQPGDDTEGGS